MPLPPRCLSLSIGWVLGEMASRRCQKKDHSKHKLICGKTRTELETDYEAFRKSGEI